MLLKSYWDGTRRQRPPFSYARWARYDAQDFNQIHKILTRSEDCKRMIQFKIKIDRILLYIAKLSNICVDQFMFSFHCRDGNLALTWSWFPGINKDLLVTCYPILFPGGYKDQLVFCYPILFPGGYKDQLVTCCPILFPDDYKDQWSSAVRYFSCHFKISPRERRVSRF